MSNRQDLPATSLVSSQKRMAQVTTILGVTATSRIITLALYFLGANLKGLAQFVGIPLDTVKAIVKRTLRDGLPALQDRRYKNSTFLPRDKTPKPLSWTLLLEKDAVYVAVDDVKRIELLRRNTTQCRTVLLTLLEAKLLTIAQVAQALGLSNERTRKLRKELIEGGVDAVVDKRRGQQKDYLFTTELKSELIQQFALNALSGWSTSGKVIANDLQQRCAIVVSERSVRLQLNKLGLSRIADSLPALLDEQKKTSSNS